MPDKCVIVQPGIWDVRDGRVWFSAEIGIVCGSLFQKAPEPKIVYEAENPARPKTYGPTPRKRFPIRR